MRQEVTFLRTHTDDDIMGSTLACRSSRVRLIWEMEAYDTFANKPQNSIAKKGGDDKMNYAKTNNQVKSVLAHPYRGRKKGLKARLPLLTQDATQT